MRFRVALVFALSLATATACGRGEKARPPAQQRPATPAPLPARPDSARSTPQKAQAQAQLAPDTVKKPAPPSLPVGQLYTVQIAAFANADSAHSLAGRLSSQGLPAWTTAGQLHGRTIHRVRVGVVPTVAEARKLGEMLQKRYSWHFWIAPLDSTDAVPAGAVQATQRILTG